MILTDEVADSWMHMQWAADHVLMTQCSAHAMLLVHGTVAELGSQTCNTRSCSFHHDMIYQTLCEAESVMMCCSLI